MFKTQTNKVLALIAMALAGCTSASGPTISADSVTLENGEQAYQVGCRGILGGMDVCQRKAQEICGDKLVRPLQARAPLDRKTSTGTPDTNVLLFQCAAPAPVAQAAPRPAAGGPLPGPAPVMPKRITLGADATFDTARSVLKPAGLQRLDQLIHDAQGMSVGVATVNGYTDSVGSDGYNQALSQRRAEAVADYLRSHGLKVDRYVVRGYGKSDPVATNATAEGRARNRRVDVLLDRRM